MSVLLLRAVVRPVAEWEAGFRGVSARLNGINTRVVSVNPVFM